MIGPPSTFRCAAAAVDRGDPLAGSAPPARRWLLLEHPGPWRVDAVAGSGIEPAVLSALTAEAARTGTRILLVRRPGRRSDAPGVRRWLLISLDGRTVSGWWTADHDLSAAAHAMAAPPAAPETTPEAVILVCTHGVHDACCAIRGRPVAAALAELWPTQVWECSHVGGDRFAPNVVVLPDGYYYGSLSPSTAVLTVRAHLAGAVQAERLRGMARHPPAVQAAVVAVHDRFAPLGPTDISVRAHRPVAGSPGVTVVELGIAGSPDLQAHVVAVRRPAAQLTCRAEQETPATQYQVRSLGGPA